METCASHKEMQVSELGNAGSSVSSGDTAKNTPQISLSESPLVFGIWF